MFINLLQEANIVQLSNSVAAAQTAVCGTTSMDQYDSVLVIAALGTVTSGSVINLRGMDGSLSNGTDAANITNLAGNVAQTGAITDSGGNTTNLVLVLDIQRIQNEYFTACFTRTSQNAVLNGLWALKYNAKDRPVTQSSSVLASAEFLAAS